MTAYYDAVLEVGQRLLWAFAVALGEDPDVFSRHATKTPSQLRLVHYPYNPDAEDGQGIGAHTDYECFTLLKPTAPGLEVLNGAGEWIDVPPVPGTFVVNIGDMLELWTNGAFVATSHRVRKVAEERYSFPLFFNVDYDTEVEAAAAVRLGRRRPACAAGGRAPVRPDRADVRLPAEPHRQRRTGAAGRVAGIGQFGQQALQAPS